MLLERCGLGLSRFASIGNQADVRLPDLVEHLAGHEPTRAIAIYAEDVADGRAFVEAARAAAARKPVILLNSGRSAAGARGAASHTGALVSSDAVIAAACREAGIVRVDSPGELIDACQAFVRSPRARGRRVAVIADGGGHGSVAADLLTANGLEVPRLLRRRWSRASSRSSSRRAASRNPVDIIDGADGLASFTGIARACLESGEVDAVMLSGYFGGYALYSDAYRAEEPREARALAGAAGRARPADRGALAVRRRRRRRHRPARERPRRVRAQRAGRARRRRAWPRAPAQPAVATAAAGCAAGRPCGLRRGARAAARGRHRLRRRRACPRRGRGRRPGRPARAVSGHAQGRRRRARAQVGRRRRARRPPPTRRRCARPPTT